MYAPGRDETLEIEGSSPAAAEAAPSPSTAELLSPSLQRVTGDRVPAFEIKFLLTETTAGMVQDWGGRRMQPDAFGDPARNGAYETTTLYLDTAARDVFHRSPGHRRRKLRLRRYGSETRIYLERKTRRGDRVKKWRSHVPMSELATLESVDCPADWAGVWFHQHLWQRALKPACRMTYDRTAFVLPGDEGPLRLTLDRNVRGQAVETWDLNPLVEGQLILPGEVICELKFRGGLPLPFKELIGLLQLEAGSVSKYRRMMTATGEVASI